MYLRITQRQNRDGSTVAYYALAESIWNPDAKRREARVVHSFGRADQLDRAALERLVHSINRVLDDGAGTGAAKTAPGIPEIDIERVFELGVVLAARALWEELGVGPAIRACTTRAKLTAPHEIALFAMAANRRSLSDDVHSYDRGVADRDAMAGIGPGRLPHRPTAAKWVGICQDSRHGSRNEQFPPCA